VPAVASNPANVALAKRWFEEVWVQRDTQVVHDLLQADSVCHTELGDLVGLQPFLDFHARILQDLPDLKVLVEEMVSEGDSVVVRWLLSATHGGKPLRFRGMTWIRYRDSKMVEGWDCWNVGGLLHQLSWPVAGSVPPG
jgi:predicted ester cyclase